MRDQPVAAETATSAFAGSIVGMLRLSDEDVLERLQHGDPDALVILFDRFHKLVLKVALRILRDRGEAEDVMQDVFFEIFNKADQFDPAKSAARTWILQYAYHRSLNRRRRLMRRNFYDRREITEQEVSESNPMDSSWRGLTVPEWRRIIKQGLATLNEKQRTTLELASFQELSLNEIAERTKETLPNVRHHYYRGLKALRKFFTAGPGSKKDSPGDLSGEV